MEEKLKGIHPTNNIWRCNVCGEDDPCILMVCDGDAPDTCIHGLQDRMCNERSKWENTGLKWYDLFKEVEYWKLKQV